MYSILKTVAASMAAVLLMATIAEAQTQTRRTTNVTPPKNIGSTSERPEFFGSATIFSDQRSQGFSSNDQDPVLQIDAGVIWRNFYFGASGSNTDLGQITVNGQSRSVGRFAVTYFAGYVNRWRNIDWDVAVSYATYPGARDDNAELDYWEGSAGASGVLVSDLKGGLRFYWSPDYTANQGHNFVLEASLQKPLPMIRTWKPTLELLAGHQVGDESRGNFDYWYWEVGVAVALNDNFSVDFRYHDTADVPISCDRLCGPRFVASATLEY